MSQSDATGNAFSWRPALAALLTGVVENDAQGVAVPAA
jgi:hypothetical protein